MSNIDDIKKNILEQMEKRKKTIETNQEVEVYQKKAKQKKNRNMYAKDWQRRYIETKRTAGLKQLTVFMNSRLVSLLDNKIIDLTKEEVMLSRSSLINQIIAEYFGIELESNKND